MPAGPQFEHLGQHLTRLTSTKRSKFRGCVSRIDRRVPPYVNDEDYDPLSAYPARHAVPNHSC